MNSLGQDIRYALGTLRRAPGFAATALLTLALGIGSTTAVFSIVYGVLMRPLPYSSANRLVRVWEEYPGGVSPAGNRWLSRSTYAAWRERATTIDALGGYALYDYPVAFDNETVKMPVALVSPAVFGMLGVSPVLGRFFTDDDDRAAAPRVAVLSDVEWRERYGAARDVVGRSAVIDGDAYTIVGVAPASFDFPLPRVRFWLPYVIPRSSIDPAGLPVFTALARLRPGVSLAQAEAEGTNLARAAPKHRLTEFFFGKGGPVIVHARRLADDVTVAVRPALSVTASAVMLVLLIACANVANLMLSRGVARQRELAIREAIGGTRGRIARQLFTESALFAAVGGVLGVALAWWLVRLVPRVVPSDLPRLDAVRIDAPVIACATLATIFAAIACGIAPAARSARLDLYEALRGVANPSGAGRPRHGLRDLLLIGEAAFAVILVVGATLLARSFVRLVTVDNGYTPDRVLVASVDLPRDATDARTDQFIAATLGRLRSMPDVTAAGAAAMIPLMNRSAIVPFAVPDYLAGRKPTHGRALVYWVTPGYVEALGLRLRDGRVFVEGDAHVGRLLTIVNEEFVRQHLENQRPVGLTLPNLVPQRKAVAEIVGVVGNVLKDGNDRQPQPELYFVHGSPGQRIAGLVNFVIRTKGNPASLTPDVRALILELERHAAIGRLEPLARTLAASLDRPRFAAAVISGFGALAMLLAAVGLYGVLSNGVAQRRHELCIRTALGAGRRDLMALVLREGLSRALIGIGAGLLAAALLTRFMRDLLFGVTPLDIVAFTAGPAVLVVVAAVACLGPALRAGRTDPAATLRES